MAALLFLPALEALGRVMELIVKMRLQTSKFVEMEIGSTRIENKNISQYFILGEKRRIEKKNISCYFRRIEKKYISQYFRRIEKIISSEINFNNP